MYLDLTNRKNLKDVVLPKDIDGLTPIEFPSNIDEIYKVVDIYVNLMDFEGLAISSDFNATFVGLLITKIVEKGKIPKILDVVSTLNGMKYIKR
jgi:hypothetical protein